MKCIHSSLCLSKYTSVRGEGVLRWWLHLLEKAKAKSLSNHLVSFKKKIVQIRWWCVTRSYEAEMVSAGMHFDRKPKSFLSDEETENNTDFGRLTSTIEICHKGQWKKLLLPPTDRPFSQFATKIWIAYTNLKSKLKGWLQWVK